MSDPNIHAPRHLFLFRLGGAADGLLYVAYPSVTKQTHGFVTSPRKDMLGLTLPDEPTDTCCWRNGFGARKKRPR